MNLRPPSVLVCSLTCILLMSGRIPAAEPDRLRVEKPAEAVIPVALSGFSGEVDGVLKYDLEVAGFEIVRPETARFNISGSSTAAVEGHVLDAAKAVVLENRRYSGGTLRSQAHAFADDIVY